MPSAPSMPSGFSRCETYGIETIRSSTTIAKCCISPASAPRRVTSRVSAENAAWPRSVNSIATAGSFGEPVA